jgi:hypothetical protein
VKKGHNLKKILEAGLWVLLVMIKILMVKIYFKFQGNISSSFKVMGKMHILLNTKYKNKTNVNEIIKGQ